MFKKTFNKTKALCTAASVAVVTASTTPMLFAATTPVDPAKVVSEIIKIVFDIFFYIGILLLAWAIGMLVLAFKNEDADSKSKAMMLLVVACVLMGIKFLFKRLNIAGFNNL